jgi:endonuclease/exonuclease/phosphatase family metal-dependent hydrolase
MSSLSIYILTFNCGLSLIDVESFASQVFSGLGSPKLPDVVVLSLQEIAPLSHAFVGGFLLSPYLGRFHHAVQSAARELSGEDDDPYSLITARNVGMTGIMVFAKDPGAIQDLETGGVGLGVADMGNKGAVGARFTYHRGDSYTELAFVAAHLAAHGDEVLRRNEDWKNIVRRLVFASSPKDRRVTTSGEERPLLSISPQDGSIYKSTSHLFVAGDLNYRTSTTKPSPADYANSFPQPDHPSFTPLFERDQLTRERTAGRTCHGLIEPPVNFPPTYKYDSKGPFLTQDSELSRWNWASHRWPSWCDRILYLDIPSWLKSYAPDAAITALKYTALPLLPTSDHRPVSLDISLPLIPIPEPGDEETDDPRTSPPFNVDINWKSRRDRARILELITGSSLYLTTTVEGGALVLSMIAGAIGAYMAIKVLLEY